jgi:hypothetical protein
MSPTIVELEKALAMQVAEHKILFAAVTRHLDAMRQFDLPTINAAADQVEQSRARVLGLEIRRKNLMAQVIRTHKLPADITLSDLADAVPAHRVSLLKVRDQLRGLTHDIANKSSVANRVAASMMGHLNTVVRLIAGAVRQASVYTKQGNHTVASRVGVMEAIG